MSILGLQLRDLAQTAGEQPLFCGGIGGLGVHVDEPTAFFDGDEVEFCLSVGIVKLLTPNLRACGQQLPATAGVFHVADF